MKAATKTGIIVIFFLFTSAEVVLSAHVSKFSVPQPAIRGTSGISIETGLSNDPWSFEQGARWNIYGNYCLDLYGVEFPFSFSISRDLQNFSHPFTRFGVSPSFGWAKLHAGISRMQFAGISSQGVEFSGAGIELTPGRFRFAGFYGKMASGNDYAYGISGNPRSKYTEKSFGVKIGMGDDQEYINLSVFNRIPRNDSMEMNFPSGQGEKQMAGLDFGFRILKNSSVSGGFNLIRTLRNKTGWGMDACLMFPAGKDRLNVSLNFLHKKADEMTESTAGLNMMWLLSKGMLGVNFGLNRVDFLDSGFGMAYRNVVANGSFMYSNSGSTVPLNLSLSVSWNRFSQEYGISSSLGASITAGTNLLKSHALNLSGSAGYNLFTGDQGSKGEIMLSCNLGYQAGNNLFSSYLNYNRIPGDEVYLINESALRKQNTYRMIAGISWSRSF